MDIKRALELLKERSEEAVRIAGQRYDASEWVRWRRNIEDILESAFGSTSKEYKRVANIEFKEVQGTDIALQREFKRRVYRIQQEVDSIIQKYELFGIEAESETTVEIPPKAFISHGKGGGALLKLEKFIKELGVEPIIVKDQPSADRTTDDKVIDYLNEADFVIIFATGDDEIKVKGKDKGIFQPRQNVIHEVGLAQKTHPGKIIYLLEERAQFPSNIRPKVYERFARQSLDDAFTAILRELRNWGFLRVGK